jgi:hypothetical protein
MGSSTVEAILTGGTIGKRCSIPEGGRDYKQYYTYSVQIHSLSVYKTSHALFQWSINLLKPSGNFTYHQV